jgi:hypothetical protein
MAPVHARMRDRYIACAGGFWYAIQQYDKVLFVLLYRRQFCNFRKQPQRLIDLVRDSLTNESGSITVRLSSNQLSSNKVRTLCPFATTEFLCCDVTSAYL